MPSKLAIFLPSLNTGGGEKVSVILVNGLIERGINIDVVLANAKGPFMQELSKVANVVGFNKTRMIQVFFDVYRYLKKNKPDVLFTVYHHTGVIALLAKFLARTKTKVVPIVHGIITLGLREESRIKGNIVFFMVKFLYRKASRIVLVSNGAKKIFLENVNVGKKETQVIYNPINTKNILRLSEKTFEHKFFNQDKPVILAIGRLVKAKGFANLITAFHKAREKVDAQLIILGEGRDRIELERLINELNLHEYVDMPGFVPNPYPYIKACDLFVIASVHESLPTVLIEALYLSKKILSTDCPYGPREVLGESRYAQLVEVNNPDLMAKGIVEQLQNDYDMTGQQEYIESKFGLEAQVNKYITLIDEVNQ